ncbi:ATP-binding protein [Aliarcobacter cryaerophilus]|nr:ATP-binding protein [Aliarcobacter cryaerophilus]
MLNKLYLLSIKTKITITLFLIIFLFSTGIFFMIKNSLSNNINTLASNTTKDLIKVNEAFFIKSLLEDDVWSIYKFLDSLTKINLITSAGFIDSSNKIIAHTNSADFPMNKEIEIKKEENLVFIPLINNGLVLGVFLIELDKFSLASLFEDLKTNIAISILIATILSFLIAYFISNSILNRLKILSHNALMIQNKQWDKIKYINSKEKDEITLFQNSMELILKKLHDSIKNEQNLRDFYHDILESLDEFILLCDYDFKILYENSHSLSNLIVKEHSINKRILSSIEMNISRNNSNFMIDIENKDGKTIYLFVIIKNLKDSLAISFSDITLLKHLQEKQCFTNSFEIVGEISSSVVHEIKNYLQPAKLLIEQDELDDEDKKRITNIISKIDFLVNEFLKTGRPIDKLLAEQIDINYQINNILNILQTQIKNKNLTIKKDILTDLKLFIAITDFETILINLIENAIDESSNNGLIYINSYIKNRHTVIEVIDFGKGINKNILKDIYKPFFTTKGEKGSGIGLYTTYKIVYMYNGFIEVESKLGKTTFSINIPINHPIKNSLNE